MEIADWVRSTTLDDDTRPHGIVYRSRHAGGDVHAYWLRAVDAGLPVTAEPVTADAGAPITAADPDLLATATRTGSGSPSTESRPSGRRSALAHVVVEETVPAGWVRSQPRPWSPGCNERGVGV